MSATIVAEKVTHNNDFCKIYTVDCTILSYQCMFKIPNMILFCIEEFSQYPSFSNDIVSSFRWEMSTCLRTSECAIVL